MEQFRRRSTELWRNLPSFRKHQPSPNSNMTGTWERIHLPPIPRSSHSLDIISGCAYIFGGEVNPHQPTSIDNDMHVIRLPFSSAGADYFTIAAKPDTSSFHSPPSTAESSSTTTPTEEKKGDLPEAAVSKSDDGDEASNASSSGSRSGSRTRQSRAIGKGKERALPLDARPILPDVPPARVGHATATIGSRILMYGGRGGPDMKPLDEGGRVWVFDTRTRAWTYLDPVPAVKGGAIIPHPAPRSAHCAAATDRPRDFAPTTTKKAETWQEWALGDTTRTGIPQDPVVGHVAEDAVDEESDGYGTFFVHAGELTSGDYAGDLWAFDVRSRTWTEFPAAPSPARRSPAICVSIKTNRIYRFGGFGGQKELGGQLDFLQLDVEMMDDGGVRGETCLRASRGGWQSIHEDIPETSSSSSSPSSTAVDEPSAPESARSWPEPRSASSLQSVTTGGGGTEYLVLAMGEKSPEEYDGGPGKFYSDVWVYQVPSGRSVFGRKAGEGKWRRVLMTPYDEEVFEMPRARGWLACAPMTDLEEAGILVWGGLDENNRRRGEGWILRLGDRDTPNGNS